MDEVDYPFLKNTLDEVYSLTGESFAFLPAYKKAMLAKSYPVYSYLLPSKTYPSKSR